MKKCIDCQTKKQLNEFSKITRRTGHRAGQTFYASKCKKCHAEYSKQYRKKNPEKVKELYSLWLEKNPTYQNEYKKKEQKLKYKTDKMFWLKHSARTRINSVLRRENMSKTTDTRTMLGCGYRELKKHLEEQFTDGMSWDNKGDWHIDHIVPLASAKTEKELIKLFHYKNLQPLWAKDNLIKGKKLLKNF